MSISSDSTYCSVYENTYDLNKKYRKSTKSRLRTINEQVMLHLQGTKLLDNNNVVRFMKEASSLRLTSYKDKYLAEKLKGFLIKIYHFNKKFEESVTAGKLSQISDPMESFEFSQNMEVMPLSMPEYNLGPVQLLASNQKPNASFPLDILTNQNFATATQGFTQEKIQQCNSQDLFSSQENVSNPINYVSSNDTMTTITLYNSDNTFNQNNSSEHDLCSEKSEDGIFKKPISSVKRKKGKYKECSRQVTTISNMHCFEMASNGNVISKSESPSECSFQDNKEEALSVDDDDSNQIIACHSLVNTEQEQTISEVMIDKFTSVCSEIANLDSHCSKSRPKLTLDIIDKLSRDMNDSYNSKVNCMYNDICNDVKSWEELSNEIEYTDTLSNDTLDTLLKLTNDIKLGETIDTEGEFEKITPSIHNFDPEEEEELDLRNVMEENKARLQAITEEFKINPGWLVNQPDFIEEHDKDDYNLLDWRVLLA